jgi:hypothetical protein
MSVLVAARGKMSVASVVGPLRVPEFFVRIEKEWECCSKMRFEMGTRRMLSLRTKTRGIYRCVALVFLAWTLTDIAVPDLCLGDADTIANSTRDQSFVQGSPVRPSGPSDSLFHRDDDCFCCCSHVLPASFVRVEMLTILASIGETAAPDTPAITPRPLFRPPRF